MAITLNGSTGISTPDIDSAAAPAFVGTNLTSIPSGELVGVISDTVGSISGTTPALDPASGGIQTWTLSGASTPTDSLSSGESMTLMIDDGTAYGITWPTMQWAGGSAPTLATTGYSLVVLWKVGSTLYGASGGDMA